jgi:hypothetical protein
MRKNAGAPSGSIARMVSDFASAKSGSSVGAPSQKGEIKMANGIKAVSQPKAVGMPVRSMSDDEDFGEKVVVAPGKKRRFSEPAELEERPRKFAAIANGKISLPARLKEGKPAAAMASKTADSSTVTPVPTIPAVAVVSAARRNSINFTNSGTWELGSVVETRVEKELIEEAWKVDDVGSSSKDEPVAAGGSDAPSRLPRRRSVVVVKEFSMENDRSKKPADAMEVDGGERGADPRALNVSSAFSLT